MKSKISNSPAKFHRGCAGFLLILPPITGVTLIDWEGVIVSIYSVKNMPVKRLKETKAELELRLAAEKEAESERLREEAETAGITKRLCTGSAEVSLGLKVRSHYSRMNGLLSLFDGLR